MHGPPVRGSLAFAADNGVIFSTGFIKSGKVSIRGPLSPDALTIAIGLGFGPGSRLCLNQANNGAFAVFLPGDVVDAVLGESSLYIAASASKARLEMEAARHMPSPSRGIFPKTGLYSQPIEAGELAELQASVLRLHACPSIGGSEAGIGLRALEVAIEHCIRFPNDPGSSEVGKHAKIVARARKYIRGRLSGPISIKQLATAAGTSRRTLARAFVEVLEESPAAFIRRMRLHGIRHDLVSDLRSKRTISQVSAVWGIKESGRMAGWYREVFGEHPRETVRTNQMLTQRLARSA